MEQTFLNSGGSSPNYYQIIWTPVLFHLFFAYLVMYAPSMLRFFKYTNVYSLNHNHNYQRFNKIQISSNQIMNTTNFDKNTLRNNYTTVIKSGLCNIHSIIINLFFFKTKSLETAQRHSHKAIYTHALLHSNTLKRYTTHKT